jgi:Fic family protein
VLACNRHADRQALPDQHSFSGIFSKLQSNKIGNFAADNRQQMLETPQRIEPALLEAVPPELGNVIGELIAASAQLGLRLHPATAASLTELVRMMNCYYSNLIEGHNTRPRDIERALRNELHDDAERRDLQLEAIAHVRVQRDVDRLCAQGTYGEPASVERIRWLHREFYRDASARMLRISHPQGDYDLVAGEFRSEPRHDVAVGLHQPPSSSRVQDFMAHFERRYRLQPKRVFERIIAMAAAHHRLNYIHPFVDGNGRVSRLMSHAMALQSGIGAHGLWSISRGLARGLSDGGEYKRMMDATDALRRGDLDGRGNLSLEALVEFVTWFCQVALDQVRFMASLFDLERLEARLRAYVEESLGLSGAAAELPIAALRSGELARGEASRVTKRPERTARNDLSSLVEAGLLVSDTPKGPVHLCFSTESADALFPRLFASS